MNILRNTIFAAAALFSATAAHAQACPGTTLVGSGCNNFGIYCAGAFAQNNTATVWASLATPGSFAVFFIGNGAPTPLDLASFGAPGCTLYTTPITSEAVILSGDGEASYDYVIPNNPMLVGLNFTVQAAALEPTVNALGLVTSNALDIVIQ